MTPLEAVAGFIAAAPDPVDGLRALATGAAIGDIEVALRAVATDATGLDPLARASLREAVIRELRRVGVTSPAALADAALGVVAQPGTDDAQGHALDLRDPEPWPEPVDGDALLVDTADLLRRYLVLPEGAAEVGALWIAHTYKMTAWDHTPYLAIVSPTRRCGKTQTLRIVGELASRAVRADDISPAALYRVIEAASPTLIIDELDRVPRDSDVWGIIHSGHTRGGTVLRCVGDEQEPRAFSTWSAKVVAYIRAARCEVPEATEDRCIRILIQRRRRGDDRDRLRSRELAAVAEPLRRRVRRWADDVGAALADARPAIPEALDDRAADGWEPLLAVADVAGGRWPTLARELAITYSAERGEDEGEAPGVRILLDLVELLDGGALRADPWGLAASSMVAALRTLPDRPWATWGRRGDGITETALGRLLRPHGIRSAQAGRRTDRCRRYDPEAIRGAGGRYTPSPCERVADTCSPAHTAVERAVSDSSAGRERVSGLEPLTEGGEREGVRL